MRIAIGLAAKGNGLVSPNPMVGAVLVKQGRIVGQGYHHRFGWAHAEVEAIHDAGKAARGSTMYVTLEPCCFYGKTPPCTDAIKRAGIKKVIAATIDPNPRVHGEGMRCLRKAGIETMVGILGKAARQLNEAYFTYYKELRPFIVLKVALTLDGMLATRDGESQWITGRLALGKAQELRCQADAVLVGVNTVLNDDPRLNCRVIPGKKLLRVVLDSDLRIRLDSRFLSIKQPVLVFTASKNRTKTQKLEKKGAEVIRIARDRNGLLSWDRIIAALYQRQIQSVLIEGGAIVASSALEAGVVDKVYAFQAAKVLGPGKSLSIGMKPRRLSQAIVLKPVRHTVFGSDVLTEGYVMGRE